MALGLNNFGRQVLGCAAERPGAILDDLGEPKIGDLDVAVLVEQQIFRFQVAIHNVLRARRRAKEIEKQKKASKKEPDKRHQ